MRQAGAMLPLIAMALVVSSLRLAAGSPARASQLFEEVRIFKDNVIPEECMYNVSDPANTFKNWVNCDNAVPGAALRCPSPEEGIPYQYIVNNQNLPLPFPQFFISSNYTPRPFSTPAIPIEELVSPTGVESGRTCDNFGRCIRAFTLIAQESILNLGFKNPDGTPLLSRMVTYNNSFPGPHLSAFKGEQTLIRLINNIFCNTTTNKPGKPDGPYKKLKAISMHLHGMASLAPFDGWTADNIGPCMHKDYVFPNDKGNQPLWYHDHALGVTAESVGSGLVGPYWVNDCGDDIPKQLKEIATYWQPGEPQYLTFMDSMFIQDEGSEYMDPYARNHTVYTLHSNKTGDIPINAGSGGWEGGDIILVNGRIWPVVTVQRKPYFFVMQNHAPSRVFNIHLTQNGESLMNAQGIFWVVGSDGGFRANPVGAANGLSIAAGERYMVVVDLTSFEPGDVLELRNFPDADSEVPTFCYTHLLLRMIVGNEPEGKQFVPAFTTPVFKETGITEEEMQEACAAAMDGKADVQMQATFNLQIGNLEGIKEQSIFGRFTFNSVTNAKTTTNPEWAINLMGDPTQVADDTHRRILREHQSNELNAKQASQVTAGQNRRLRGGAGRELSQVVKTNGTVLPTSMATNGWTTWWMYNPFPAVHPIHIHLVSFFVCGRRNIRGWCRPGIDPWYPCPPEGPAPHYGVRDFEILTPKDIVMVPAFGQVAVIARYGPHQGSYQFHCHNLIHEDEGLMAVFNSTSPKSSNPTFQSIFAPGATEANRYAGGYGKAPVSPGRHSGPDPLVNDDPNDPAIAHDLYGYGSMPPRLHKTDASGRPLPLTDELLQKVLERNYYEVFYPNGRKSLAKPVKGNKFAVICPKKPKHQPA